MGVHDGLGQAANAQHQLALKTTFKAFSSLEVGKHALTDLKAYTPI